MPTRRLQPGPIPLHHQVYLDLRASLDARTWQVGDQLPTERDLATGYRCSLITVRRALDELVREGRLERTRGRGTFVTAPPIVRDLAARAGFADEMRARGLEPFATVVTQGDEPGAPAVAAELRLSVGAPTHFLERVRGAAGVPLLLERAWLPADRFPGLLDEDFSVASLYDVLEHRFGCPIERTLEMIAPYVPDAREARLLGLPRRRPALLLEGTAFSVGGVPVEFSRTIVSGERARYYVETTGGRSRSLRPVSLDSNEGQPAPAGATMR